MTEYAITSHGYVEYTQELRKEIWLTKDRCLLCGKTVWMTANPSKMNICKECWDTRKSRNRRGE